MTELHEESDEMCRDLGIELMSDGQFNGHDILYRIWKRIKLIEEHVVNEHGTALSTVSNLDHKK